MEPLGQTGQGDAGQSSLAQHGPARPGVGGARSDGDEQGTPQRTCHKFYPLSYSACQGTARLSQGLVQQLSPPLMSFTELINFQTTQNKLRDVPPIEKEGISDTLTCGTVQEWGRALGCHRGRLWGWSSALHTDGHPGLPQAIRVNPAVI